LLSELLKLQMIQTFAEWTIEASKVIESTETSFSSKDYEYDNNLCNIKRLKTREKSDEKKSWSIIMVLILIDGRCHIKYIHNNCTIILFIYLLVLEIIVLFILIYHNKIVDNKLFHTPGPAWSKLQAIDISYWVLRSVKNLMLFPDFFCFVTLFCGKLRIRFH
jgi:hypothetical protein